MINKKEWNRMIAEKLYNPYKVGGDSFEIIHAAQKNSMSRNIGKIKLLLKN